MHKDIQTQYGAARNGDKVTLLSRYVAPIDDIWFVDKVCLLVSSLVAIELITYKNCLHLVLNRARDNSIARNCLLDVGRIRSVVTNAIDKLTTKNRASEAEKYRQFLGTLDEAIEPLIGITVDVDATIDDEATAPPISEMSTTWSTNIHIQEAVASWKLKHPDIYVHKSVYTLMGMIEVGQVGLKTFSVLQNLVFTETEPFFTTVHKWMDFNRDLLAQTPALAVLVQNICPFYENYPSVARLVYLDAAKRNSWFGYDFESANDWTDYWRDATVAAVNGGVIEDIKSHGLVQGNGMPMRVVRYDNMKATLDQIAEWKHKAIGLVLEGDKVEWPSIAQFNSIQFMHASGIGDSVPKVPNVVALELESLKIENTISLVKTRFIRLDNIYIADSVALAAPEAELVFINAVSGGGSVRLPKTVVLETAMVPDWTAWVPEGALHATADSLEKGLPSADFGVLEIVQGPVNLQITPGSAKMRINRLELVQCWDLHEVNVTFGEGGEGKLIEKCVLQQCTLLSPQNLDFLYYCTSLTFANTSVIMDNRMGLLSEYPHLARIKLLGMIPLCITEIIYRATRLLTLRLERAFTFFCISVKHELLNVSVHELHGHAEINVSARVYELDSSSLRLMGKIGTASLVPPVPKQIHGVEEEEDNVELDRVFGSGMWTIV